MPFTGSHRSGGRDHTQVGQGVGILLTLADENDRRGNDSGQVIEHQPDTFDVPNPTTISIRPALPEVLREESDALIEQRPLFIAVLVFRNNLALWFGAAYD